MNRKEVKQINEILWAIIWKIKVTYPNIEIYMGSVPETEKGQCFVVDKVTNINKPQMSDRTLKSYTVAIAYHHGQEEWQYEDMCQIGDLLAKELKSITLEDQLPIYATESKVEIERDTLVFSTNYEIITKARAASQTQMATLTENTIEGGH